MDLRVRCKCGRSLKISSALAGKKLTCPGCRKIFRIPIEKFQATEAGDRPTHEPETLNAPAQTTPAPTLIELETAPVELDVAVPSAQPVGEAPVAEAVAVTTAAPMSYAAASGRPATTSASAGLEVIQQPKRTFWNDILYAFAYPVANKRNLVNFATVCFILVVARNLGCFGGIVYAWLASVYMNVVSATAVGEDDFDGATLEGGVWEAIIIPAWTYAGTFLLAMSPAFLYGVLTAVGIMPASTAMLVTWTAFGIFMWPMIMLLFSLSSWTYLFQIHMVFATIARTIVPYIVIWIAVAFSFGLMTASSQVTTFLASAGFSSFLTSGPTASGITSVVLLCVGSTILRVLFETYFSVVSMRLIGLYYLHYKDLFAFVME